MAGGSTSGASLEDTPTWAVAVVCFVLVIISIVIEHSIELVAKWFKKRHKRALFEALEKVKSELMLLGFISLLLTVGQTPISSICISESVAATWHPCKNKKEEKVEMEEDGDGSRRRLLSFYSGEGLRRSLAGGVTDKCAEKRYLYWLTGVPFHSSVVLGDAICLTSQILGMVPFISSGGIHQLHIFIFVLAVFHVVYCILTLALGSAKMKKWKSWEMETKSMEYQFAHDPERFRFARDTTFGRRHLSIWAKNPVLLWVVCFFRQFFRSVPKVDYMTLRHGFIMAHLAPHAHANFDFQKYIRRSLEEDFKVVVGISPPIWFLAVLFLLFNTHGWYSYLWLPFVPLIIILLVGTKLQVVITKMALRIQERGEVVKGLPVVEPGDDLFWLNRPHLVLFLINFVLFQNAFQLAFFAWTLYEFGFGSCFHENVEDVIIRITMGVVIQFLCSYVTLPLYALVTQMGSNMKPTIFNERVATALRHWHHTAKKHIKKNKNSMSVTPVSSRPGTPSQATSPVHLLRHYRGDIDSTHTSPRRSSFDEVNRSYWEATDNGSLSPSYHHHHADGSSTSPPTAPQFNDTTDHEVAASVPDSAGHLVVDIAHEGLKDFSFDRRPGS